MYRKGVAVHLLKSKDFVEILLTGFSGHLMYQLYTTAKEMKMV